MLKRTFFILACFALSVPLGLSGQVWDPDVRLTNEINSSNSPSVAVSGDTVHLVWYDSRDGNDEIYYKRSTDGGISWGADTRLTNDANESNYSSVAVSGLTVHVVWQDSRDGNPEIYYKRSTNGGTSWGSDTRLTNDANNSYSLSVSVSDDTIHVVWYDDRDGNNEIYYKRSTDGGVSWGTDTRLTNDASDSYYPSVAVSGSNVHVVWRDSRDGNPEIYYKRSIDAGSSWGSDTRLTNNNNISTFPKAAVSGSYVYVVWRDNRDGNAEIYCKRSADGGVYWDADTRLTNNGSSSETPSVAVSGSNVHVVWYDARDGNENEEIYYKHSTNYGETWGTDTRLTNDGSFSEYPSVAVRGSSVHVVWRDERDGNPEIYYKRGGDVQPDNLVKNFGESEYIGDDVYNDDGEEQTREQTITSGDTAIYHIRIENDGNLSDTVTVTGLGSVEGWTVSYFDALSGGTDITSDVTGSGWSIEDFEPGDYVEIRVEVSPDTVVPGDSTYGILVTSTSDRDDTKLDAVLASTTTELACQPDNQIKNSDESVYTGDGIYNTDGTDQTKTQYIDAGATAVYHIMAENDGNHADTFVVTGTPGNAGWTVRYFDALIAGTEITSDIIGAGWSTGELASGGVHEIRVEVTSPASAPDGTFYDVLVTATSAIDDTYEDAVKASSTVGTGVEEGVSVPLVYSLDVSTLSSGRRGFAVSYGLPTAASVTLSLYDAAGRAVKILNLGTLGAGSHTAELGTALSEGVYFVRLVTDDKTLTRKVLLIH